MCTFLFWMEHCEIWNRCILGFVNQVHSVHPCCIMGTTIPWSYDHLEYQCQQCFSFSIWIELVCQSNFWTPFKWWCILKLGFVTPGFVTYLNIANIWFHRVIPDHVKQHDQILLRFIPASSFATFAFVVEIWILCAFATMSKFSRYWKRSRQSHDVWH